jgi:hypothetical protein
VKTQDSAPRSLTSNRLLLAFSLSIFFAWIYLSEWLPLTVQKIGGGRNYADLNSVLQAAECYKVEGAEVYSSITTCVYQYGLFLLEFINFFNLNALNFKLLGFILFVAVTSILITLAVVTVNSKIESVLAFVLIISPGPWLLFERGNFDLLIIVFLALGVFAINTRFSILSIVFLALTALMKFYTLPLFLLYIIIEKNSRLKRTAIYSLLMISPIVIHNILSAESHPNPLFVAFGLPAPGLWTNFFAWRFGVPLELGMISLYSIGFLVVLFGLYLMYFSPIRGKFLVHQISAVSTTGVRSAVFLFSAGTYVSCFLAGMNYDYRLIFLIFALLVLNASYAELRRNWWFTATQVSALWATYFFFGATGPIPVLLAFFGNFCQLVLALYLMGAIYKTLQVSYGLSEVQQSAKQWILRKAGK